MNSIDLHLMCSETALRAFREKYNEFYREGSRSEIKVIHGYGSGSLSSSDVIRQKLRNYIMRNKEYMRLRIDLNQGVTYVTPLKLLPQKK